ncbi:hypothetical protein CXG81DRAFT_16940 [Caulochytrium protostelioides]|uniref:Atos-like conserved domain-containing protein n=1 Tax=Caulochytrium protostelioides TaxID=1555241 RepID=A0A4P9XDL4_9FUNG|nr:hypothetical protein CXG81DRAFT_16940 [Caulochytrium protostelioides]|eukprot:RKP03563.1 hypothetical protein CXG81DRAFT_16940 [Caulochytrium protostelioides]
MPPSTSAGRLGAAAACPAASVQQPGIRAAPAGAIRGIAGAWLSAAWLSAAWLSAAWRSAAWRSAGRDGTGRDRPPPGRLGLDGMGPVGGGDTRRSRSRRRVPVTGGVIRRAALRCGGGHDPVVATWSRMAPRDRPGAFSVVGASRSERRARATCHVRATCTRLTPHTSFQVPPAAATGLPVRCGAVRCGAATPRSTALRSSVLRSAAHGSVVESVNPSDSTRPDPTRLSDPTRLDPTRPVDPTTRACSATRRRRPALRAYPSPCVETRVAATLAQERRSCHCLAHASWTRHTPPSLGRRPRRPRRLPRGSRCRRPHTATIALPAAVMAAPIAATPTAVRSGARPAPALGALAPPLAEPSEPDMATYIAKIVQIVLKGRVPLDRRTWRQDLHGRPTVRAPTAAPAPAPTSVSPIPLGDPSSCHPSTPSMEVQVSAAVRSFFLAGPPLPSPSAASLRSRPTSPTASFTPSDAAASMAPPPPPPSAGVPPRGGSVELVAPSPCKPSMVRTEAADHAVDGATSLPPRSPVPVSVRVSAATPPPPPPPPRSGIASRHTDPPRPQPIRTALSGTAATPLSSSLPSSSSPSDGSSARAWLVIELWADHAPRSSGTASPRYDAASHKECTPPSSSVLSPPHHASVGPAPSAALVEWWSIQLDRQMSLSPSQPDYSELQLLAQKIYGSLRSLPLDAWRAQGRLASDAVEAHVFLTPKKPRPGRTHLAVARHPASPSRLTPPAATAAATTTTTAASSSSSSSSDAARHPPPCPDDTPSDPPSTSPAGPLPAGGPPMRRPDSPELSQEGLGHPTDWNNALPAPRPDPASAAANASGHACTGMHSPPQALSSLPPSLPAPPALEPQALPASAGSHRGSPRLSASTAAPASAAPAPSLLGKLHGKKFRTAHGVWGSVVTMVYTPHADVAEAPPSTWVSPTAEMRAQPAHGLSAMPRPLPSASAQYASTRESNLAAAAAAAATTTTTTTTTVITPRPTAGAASAESTPQTLTPTEADRASLTAPSSSQVDDASPPPTPPPSSLLTEAFADTVAGTLGPSHPAVPALPTAQARVGSPMPSPTLQKRVVSLSHMQALFRAQVGRSHPLRPRHDEDVEAARERDRAHERTIAAEREKQRRHLAAPVVIRPGARAAIGSSEDAGDLKLVDDGADEHRDAASGMGLACSPRKGEPFGTLVGSYEESIVSGRMSLVPSKPVHFLADIGVVGLGKCPQALRCPPHLQLSFPAFCYDLPGDTAHVTSPYVGAIPLPTGGFPLPPRGQLQILIMNANPADASQRAALKLFLLSYDLRAMPPNTRTFLRQKSYRVVAGGRSAGASRSASPDGQALPSPSPPPPPPLSPPPRSPPSIAQRGARLAVPSPTPSSPTHPTPTSRGSPLLGASPIAGEFMLATGPSQPPSMRYAVQVHFASDAQGAIALAGTIRVVFGHRYPDRDEQFETVVDGPAPGERFLHVD